MKFETVLAAWKRRKKTRITGVVSVTVDLMRTRATAKLKVRSPVVLFAGKNSSADCSSSCDNGVSKVSLLRFVAGVLSLESTLCLHAAQPPTNLNGDTFD